MQKRFRELFFIGKILKLVAVVNMILATTSIIIAPLTFAINDEILPQFGFLGLRPGDGLVVGLLLGIILFIAFSVSGLLLFAVGELINVFINIEENTRMLVAIKQEKI